MGLPHSRKGNQDAAERHRYEKGIFGSSRLCTGDPMASRLRRSCHSVALKLSKKRSGARRDVATRICSVARTVWSMRRTYSSTGPGRHVCTQSILSRCALSPWPPTAASGRVWDSAAMSRKVTPMSSASLLPTWLRRRSCAHCLA
eukprot:scaffold71162_cov73-Phaeocystis_antarctica.AAC.6